VTFITLAAKKFLGVVVQQVFVILYYMSRNTELKIVNYKKVCQCL